MTKVNENIPVEEIDVAVPVGEPRTEGIHILTPEAWERVREASEKPRPITPRMRQAIETHRRLTGRSPQ